MTKRKPSPYDVHRGECSVTITGVSGLTFNLEVAWEVEAESLDYDMTHLQVLDGEEEELLLDKEKIRSGRYGLPAFLRRNYDAAIREGIWDQISDSIPFISENHYVN